MDLQRGTAARLPYLAAGTGRPLVYLAGLLPRAGVDTKLAHRTARASLAPLARGRRVFFVNRRTDLPEGTTMAALASEHADAIRSLGAGPVDVLGISTGGSIAQQLAADHPGVVDRLVLVSTGCRLGDRARTLQRRVAADVRAGKPERALATVALSIVAPNGEALGRAAAPLFSPLAARAGDLWDLAATIEAEDAFDLAACRTIEALTLIVAGERDRFYGRALLEETARLIPRSTLRIFPRRGHVTVTAGRRFPALVDGFLAGDHPVSR
jgi:pimeloyl-ACP methyl ester carboxylesterase